MTIAGDRFGKVFNALTGLELRTKILSDVSELLLRDDRFQNNVAYPKVGYKFSLTIAVYPREPATFSLSKEFSAGEDPGTAPIELVIEQEHPGGSPNEIRAELGLPVPRPQETPVAGVVDFPDKDERTGRPGAIVGSEPTAPREKPLERVLVGGASGERTEAVEIPGHVTEPHEVRIPERPVVSVTQKTNAYPEGRAVDDHVPHLRE